MKLVLVLFTLETLRMFVTRVDDYFRWNIASKMAHSNDRKEKDISLFKKIH